MRITPTDLYMGVKALSLKIKLIQYHSANFHNNVVIENGDTCEDDNSIKISLAVVSIQL